MLSDPENKRKQALLWITPALNYFIATPVFRSSSSIRELMLPISFCIMLISISNGFNTSSKIASNLRSTLEKPLMTISANSYVDIFLMIFSSMLSLYVNYAGTVKSWRQFLYFRIKKGIPSSGRTLRYNLFLK